MKSLQRPIAVLVMLTAALSACGGGGSDDKADPTPTKGTATALDVKPADGDTISTDDFTYTVPKDWKESSETRALTLAIDSKDPDGFSDNINVVADKTIVGMEGDELEDAVKRALDGVATDVKIGDRVAVDGEEAVHVGAIFDSNGIKYRTEQYAVAHDDAGYVVTVSFSPDVPAAERDEVSESILTTWKWSS